MVVAGFPGVASGAKSNDVPSAWRGFHDRVEPLTLCTISTDGVEIINYPERPI